MAVVQADTLDNISAKEEGDIITELVRTVHVTGLLNTNQDYTIWDEVRDALDAAGLTSGSKAPPYNNLRLGTRNFRLLGDSPTKAKVTLVYQNSSATFRKLPTEENEGAAGVGNLTIDGASSLQQETTELDFDSNQITVQHTWPPEDPTKANETQVQGGSLSVLTPYPTVSISTKFTHSFPTIVQQNWVGFVNSFTWNAGAARTWLCTSVNYQDSDSGASPPVWQFVFTFAHKSTGWDPTAVFIDERTGKPPADLVDGVGLKTVTFYPEFDFNTEFPL